MMTAIFLCCMLFFLITPARPETGNTVIRLNMTPSEMSEVIRASVEATMRQMFGGHHVEDVCHACSAAANNAAQALLNAAEDD